MARNRHGRAGQNLPASRGGASLRDPTRRARDVARGDRRRRALHPWRESNMTSIMDSLTAGTRLLSPIRTAATSNEAAIVAGWIEPSGTGHVLIDGTGSMPIDLPGLAPAELLVAEVAGGKVVR